jgi:hypothetical protein
MKSFIVAAFIAFLGSLANSMERIPKTIHVFVALCDNKYQGIVPVPEHLGRGDDLNGNLYWGCSGGVRQTFSQSPHWVQVSAIAKPRRPILERVIFRHKNSGAILIADAYEGKYIKSALEDFIAAVSGNEVTGQEVTAQGLKISGGAGANLVIFLGHNGLMDFQLPSYPKKKGTATRECIVLCCKSEQFFSGIIGSYSVRPILLTRQLMYPGAMVIESAIEGWLKNEGLQSIRDRAAEAYAKNQTISIRSARSIFWRAPADEK